MNNLMYPVKRDFTNWLAKVDEMFGEITPELEKELAIIEANQNNRLLTLKDYVISNEEMIKAVEERISYFSNIKSNIIKKTENVKEYIYNYMKESGLDKVTNGIDKLSIRKSPPKIEVTDEEKIPDRYFRYGVTLNHAQYIALLTILNDKEIEVPKVTKTINKQAIKNDSKNDIGISGTRKTQGSYLKID